MEADIFRFLVLQVTTFAFLVRNETFGPLGPSFLDTFVARMRSRISQQFKELRERSRQGSAACAYYLGSPGGPLEMLDTLEGCARKMRSQGQSIATNIEATSAVAFVLASSETMKALEAGLIQGRDPPLPLNLRLPDQLYTGLVREDRAWAELQGKAFI